MAAADDPPERDLLTIGRARAPSGGRRRLRLAGGIAAVLAGIVALLVWLIPFRLSSHDVRRAYDPPPVAGVDWEKSTPLRERAALGTSWVDQLGSECQPAAPALLLHRTGRSVDGYAAQFELPTGRWGTSSTARYRDRADAAADFDLIAASLAACKAYTLPSRYGTVAVSSRPAPVDRSLFGSDRVRYLLTYSADGQSWGTVLTGLRFANSITWQTYEVEATEAESDGDADQLMDAVRRRLQSGS